jgi:hypothetical protein
VVVRPSPGATRVGELPEIVNVDGWPMSVPRNTGHCPIRKQSKPGFWRRAAPQRAHGPIAGIMICASTLSPEFGTATKGINEQPVAQAWGMQQLTLAMVGFEGYVKTTRRTAFLAEMEQVVP